MIFDVLHYNYADRIGNLQAEAVGVVKGERDREEFMLFRKRFGILFDIRCNNNDVCGV